MNAKINFSSDRVGDHPNFIKFIGAVVDDVTMGPMIIYEFRENKTLRDYIEKNKSNMTVEMQENLFRFGLDIAKGMDYLTTKGVTHRRLAARNILLNHLNEVKIAGFGPQTAGEEDGRDAETGKKVRLRTPYTGKSRNLPQCLKRGEHLEKPGICDETIVGGTTPRNDPALRRSASNLTHSSSILQQTTSITTNANFIEKLYLFCVKC
ncbi:SVH2-like protein [Mya arenaria]|uniref:SVH2-like protein n=1 Tax=Mya arenaria TaxID=6604 RepID=A0ABY7FFQ2_MYAAR|nr:SVH2-like protein [Mya arenaria]